MLIISYKIELFCIVKKKWYQWVLIIWNGERYGMNLYKLIDRKVEVRGFDI